MEGFSYQMNESGGDMDHLGFINRNEFNSSDVEQVLFAAQGGILDSIEQIGECQDSTFLNPINDILGDINEFGKNFCCEQEALPASNNSQQNNNSWPLQESVEGSSMSSYMNMPERTKVTVENVGSANACSGNASVNGNVGTDPMKCVGGGGVATVTDTVAGNGGGCGNTGVVGDGYFNVSGGGGGGNGNGNDTSVLIPEATVEFPVTAADCAFLGGEYSSTINQWFQSLEQQQMSFMAMPPMAAPLAHPQMPSQMGQHCQGYSETFLSTIGGLPTSTTITPISVDEQQLVHRPVPGSPLQLQPEVTIEARFVPERAGVAGGYIAPRGQVFQSGTFVDELNALYCGQQVQQDTSKFKTPNMVDRNEWRQSSGQANFNMLQNTVNTKVYGKATGNNTLYAGKTANAAASMRKQPAIGFQKSRLHWTAVFPRKQFIAPPEMIIMQPLRTRKLMTPRRTVPTNIPNSCSATINLAEYFDTSSIEIPMIKERTRGENRNENRRKQKMQIIPGSENFIFEIQRNDYNCNELINISPSVDEYFETDIDPYPETELPELDEIFKRKKKTSTAPTVGSKRACPISQPQAGAGGTAGGASGAVCSGGGGGGGGGPGAKKQCPNVTVAQASVQETSTSFEEKVSVSISIRKGRSNLPIDQNDLTYSSESDSVESDDENGKNNMQSGKSLKCQKCKKLFKTTRSLAIHTKRCVSVSCDSQESGERIISCPNKEINDNNSANDNDNENDNDNSDKIDDSNSKQVTSNTLNMQELNLPKLSRIPSDNIHDLYSNTSPVSEDETDSTKTMGGNDMARPITRSQTRRSSRRVTGVTTLKRSK